MGLPLFILFCFYAHCIEVNVNCNIETALSDANIMDKLYCLINREL